MRLRLTQRSMTFEVSDRL